MHVAFPLGYHQTGNHYHYTWWQQIHYDCHGSCCQALTGWDVPVSRFTSLANKTWNEPWSGSQGLLDIHTQHTLQACHCQMNDSQHPGWYELELAHNDSGCHTLLSPSIYLAHTNASSGVLYNYYFQRLLCQVQATPDIYSSKVEYTIYIKEEKMMQVSKGRTMKTFKFDQTGYSSHLTAWVYNIEADNQPLHWPMNIQPPTHPQNLRIISLHLITNSIHSNV